MTFRPRYLVALLWHWSFPFVMGMCAAWLLWGWQVVELAPLLEESFANAAREVCK